MCAISLGEPPYKIRTIISQRKLELLGLGWDPEPPCRPTIADICQTLGISQPFEEIWVPRKSDPSIICIFPSLLF
ncbi:hypothetical protein BS47DRAFT_1349282 [Hydnum rufescens UP504]|uniref:Uncharacterized protein n=1 Tax=Hydnum rufescens UP504 TaxID=1448309 RepID=A0A9P6DNV7_9AGAM|nr:hypothetical protein BS47DRAFT_1349282 [Hydnum rufescens UP504]